jgi:DNA-binding NarL/FixJ family response regulator
MGGSISKQALMNSFNKIKSHFLGIEAKISQNMAKLDEIEKTLKLLQELSSHRLNISQKVPQEISSTGNQGVQSINQSLINQSINHINTHFLPNPQLATLFQTLTNKEFLVFLTIFQSDQITYEQIAQKLSLTLSCVRSYVSELLRKKSPLIKYKLKNRKTILSVQKDFKMITSEQKLVNLYYKGIDPTQTTLI